MKQKSIFISLSLFMICLFSIGFYGCDNSEPTKYSITYYLDGGINNNQNPIEFSENNEEIVLSKPTKDGYDFDGWYEDSLKGKKVDKIEKNKNKNVSLYAKWNAKLYQINFNPVGGKVLVSKDNAMIKQDDYFFHVPYGSKFTTLPGAVKDNCKFLGWFLTKNGGDRITEDSIYLWTKDITLFANWECDESLNISQKISEDKSKLTLTVKNNGEDYNGILMLRMQGTDKDKSLTLTNFMLGNKKVTVKEKMSNQDFLGYDLDVSIKNGETIIINADINPTKNATYILKTLTSNCSSSSLNLEINKF